MKLRLRQIREKRGMTLDELAAITPFDKSQLSRLETGRTNFAKHHLEALSAALDVSPGELIEANSIKIVPILGLVADRGEIIAPDDPGQSLGGIAAIDGITDGNTVCYEFSDDFRPYAARGDIALCGPRLAPVDPALTGFASALETANGVVYIGQLLATATPDRWTIAPLIPNTAPIFDAELASARRVILILPRAIATIVDRNGRPMIKGQANLHEAERTQQK
ncbi:MAG: helix-turn-helix domain-containing protein [Neomegalonema sp.]|nr:helix-turn-helix domain-containing protein [Neomegalonema sp.]